MKLLLILTVIVYWYSAKAVEVEGSANPSFLLSNERSTPNIERRVDAKPMSGYLRLGRSDGKSFKNFIRINRGDAPGSEEKAQGDFFIRLGKRGYFSQPDENDDSLTNEAVDYWSKFNPNEELEYREIDPNYLRYVRSHPTMRYGK